MEAGAFWGTGDSPFIRAAGTGSCGMILLEGAFGTWIWTVRSPQRSLCVQNAQPALRTSNFQQDHSTTVFAGGPDEGGVAGPPKRVGLFLLLELQVGYKLIASLVTGRYFYPHFSGMYDIICLGKTPETN